jgi:antitoxin component YwqK of YwqJK toxin-antitoxin module
MRYIILLSLILLAFSGCKRTLKRYYSSGELEAEFYKDDKGLRQGDVITYYRNGNITTKGYCLNDTFVGEYMEYYADGQLKIHTTFLKGVQNGELLEYFEDGKIRQEANYVNGKSEGVNIFYYHNGKISTMAMLREGITQYYTTYDSLGNETEKKHSMYLEILSPLNKADSIIIRERIPGFVADNMNPMYAVIEKYGTIKEGDVPKMRLNPADSMYYITFPPQKDTGRYVIKTFFHAVYKLKYFHENDTIITIR